MLPFFELQEGLPIVKTSSHWEGALVTTSQGLFSFTHEVSPRFEGWLRSLTLESKKNASRWEGIFSSPPPKKKNRDKVSTCFKQLVRVGSDPDLIWQFFLSNQCHFSGGLGAIPGFRNCKCYVVSVGWFQCDGRLELPDSKKFT